MRISALVEKQVHRIGEVAKNAIELHLPCNFQFNNFSLLFQQSKCILKTFRKF